MRQDDLDAPLRGGPTPTSRRPFSLARLAFGALALAAISLFVWLTLVDDPLGGDPVAKAAIERRLAPTGPAAKAPEPEPTMRGGVPIIGAGEPMPASGPVIIRVPGTDTVAAGGPAAPVAALSEDTRFGPLPRIAPDGTRASERYARPAPVADGPRVAILVAGLGLDDATAAEAVGHLPPEAGLGLGAGAPGLESLLAGARESGRETLLLLSLEGYGATPDPLALLTDLPPEANLERLRRVMGRATGYVGLAGIGGDKFAASEAALGPVLVEIGRRGLLFVDAGASPNRRIEKIAAEIGLAAAHAEAVIGPRADATAIDAELARLESVARRQGRALGVASPAAVDRIAAWAAGLSARGVTLVPVSALTLPHPAAVVGAR